MESFDTLRMKGDVYVIKTKDDGTEEKYFYPNLVVTAGKNFITNRMSANTVNIMNRMAVGNSSTAANASDTTLGGEVARVALDVTGGTPSSNTITFAATFPAGTATDALTEAGLFNSTSGGTMLCRTVFPVINKGAADTISISWVVSII